MKKIRNPAIIEMLRSKETTNPIGDTPGIVQDDSPLTAVVSPGGLVLAPLAGYTNHIFREMISSLGASATWTEMISSEGLVREQPNSIRYLKNIEAEPQTVVQLFGSKPNVVADAAQYVQDRGARAIDINMGCPVRKVMKHGSGVALMANPERAAALIRLTRRAITIPLLIKIRTGWDNLNLNYLEIARMAENEGVDALTLHARSRTMGYNEPAHWEHISRTVDALSIPVIGNGDIHSIHDAIAMEQQTGCFALMIGRAALHDPWIFRQFSEFKKSNRHPEEVQAQEKLNYIRTHLLKNIEEFGELSGIRKFRKYLLSYVSNLPGVSRIRTALVKIDKADQLLTLLEDYFSRF